MATTNETIFAKLKEIEHNQLLIVDFIVDGIRTILEQHEVELAPDIEKTYFRNLS